MQGFRHTALPPQYYSGDLPMKGDIENIYEANIDYREGTLDSDRGLSSYINGWYGRGQKTKTQNISYLVFIGSQTTRLWISWILGN